MSKQPSPTVRRDVDDLERVLAALLSQSSREDASSGLVAKYLSSNADRFRRAHVLTSPRGLPPLSIKKGAPVRLGGGGIVICCSNPDLPIEYALKVPRPSLFKGNLEQAAEEYRTHIAEYLKHAPLSHRNVARVFGGGLVDVTLASGIPIPMTALLMEWIDRPTQLSAYLLERQLGHIQVVDLLIQCFEGLSHIHSRNLIHWDIKADNLLIDSTGTVKITDLGNSRRNDDPTRKLTALSTRRNLPPTLEPPPDETATEIAHSFRRTPVNLPDLDWDCPWLDMWMFARELNRLFLAEPDLLELDEGVDHRQQLAEAAAFLADSFAEEDDAAQLTLKFLRLILRRLLQPTSPHESLFYESADTVVRDLRKLLPEFGAAQPVQELQAIPQRVLRLPQTGNAPYSPRIGRLFNSRLVQRLSRHYQLGTLAQVYPGATHRRSEHAAGVAATAAQFVRALFADRTDPFWRISIESRDIDALLMAALLHDVGHIAFGHYLEEMAGLFKDRLHEDYVLALVDPHRATSSSSYADEDRTELQRLVKEDWVESGSDAASFMAYVGEILRPVDWTDAILQPNAELNPQQSRELKVQLLHSIIDSAIDADKLDYLLRDAYHCGVKYGRGVDEERFFQSLVAVARLDHGDLPSSVAHPGHSSPPHQEDLPYSFPEEPQRAPVGTARLAACIGVSEKGVLPVESILIARYHMFSSVYWHHTARAETAMLQHLVQEFVRLGSSEPLAQRRLDLLIDKFRSLGDREALRWLKGQLLQDSRGQRRRELLASMCDGLLGARKALFWTVFELHYKRGFQREPTREQTLRRAVLENLTQISDALGKITTAQEFLARTKTFRGRFTRLVADGFRVKFGAAISFEDGELLVDIPPAGADQIENVFVWTQEGVRSIQEVSPIADAVSDAFRYWARRVRVFLAPHAWDKCSAARITRDQLAKVCWYAMKQIGADPNPQMLLFPEPED